MQGLKAPLQKGVNHKAISKMKLLTKCQANFIQVIFQKIDRRSKPIRKQEKMVNLNLKKKNIYLEEENFDILSLLQKNSKAGKQDLKLKAQTESKDFQKPLAIGKSKPLKSEKDGVFNDKGKASKP